MMSSPFIPTSEANLMTVLHLVVILVLALIAVRLLRGATNKLVKPAGTQTPPATQTKGSQQKEQEREQQTRALADKVYGAGSKLIWILAVLTALPEFGISALPAAAIAGATILGFSIGARELIRDATAGYQILTEEPFLSGDTIQAEEIIGRVEQVSLRRTVVRDGRGALVSIANGEMRTVSNLSRDWSQAFVDVGVAAGTPLEKTLQALESAAAALRGDAAWSQALVDGPRVLGVQGYDAAGTTVRVQVRTAPTRQDEVCRELRRRIQMELQRQGIAASSGKPAGGAPLT
jgi:moderate conductance mechanosensitive channel